MVYYCKIGKLVAIKAGRYLRGDEPIREKYEKVKENN